MKNLTLVFWVIFCFAFNLLAQDDYQKWLKQEQEKMKKFKTEEDKKFLEFLEKEWKAVKTEKSIKPDEKPKSPIPPRIVPTDETIAEKQEVKNVLPPPKIEEKKEEISPPKIDKKNDEFVSIFNFYGVRAEITHKKDLFVLLKGKLENKSISNYWNDISSQDYKPLLEQFDYYKEVLGFNDLALAKFIYYFAKKNYGEKDNEAKLFVWFSLLKLGFKARIGIKDDKEILLLLASKEKIYGVPYITQDNERYYIADFEKPQFELQGDIYTYEGEFPGVEKKLEMSYEKAPKFDNKLEEKKLKFKYKGVEYNITVRYNKNSVDYFYKHPYVELPVYFKSSPSEFAASSLVNSLKEIVKDKSETEAANIILRFCQTAFDYKTDQEQFGWEKPMFIDEILNYEFSDCEDRTILFIFLVKNILGLDAIAIDYPGHLAAAVKFNSDVQGDFVMFKNQKYIICDPTYINANIGMAMPNFKNVKPEIIAF